MLPVVSSTAGEKLLNPSQYGFEEYLVIFLFAFVVFVAIKHLIFHTLYFWWYGYGRFYIPEKIYTIFTGKSIYERVLTYVQNEIQGTEETAKLDHLLNVIDSYCANVCFSPNMGAEKGEIFDRVINKCQPQSVLIVGCHLGYVLIRCLRLLPQSTSVYVIEPNMHYVLLAKKWCKLVGREVEFVCKEPCEALDDLRSGCGVETFDFVFLNRITHDQPSFVPFLNKLEASQMLRAPSSGEDARGTHVLADHVVALEGADYLLHVRKSESFTTEYHQMALEHCSSEIIDGMELAIYTGPV